MAITTPEERGVCIYPETVAAEFVSEKKTLPTAKIGPENRPGPKRKRSYSSPIHFQVLR